ncbi:AI-2E family transporter [bacterium]|nr:AI-2E family transporter [bacterium]
MKDNTIAVMNKTIAVCLGFLTLCVVIYILKIGKTILLPLVIAVCLWYLINSLQAIIKSVSIKGYSLPSFICYIIALCIISGVVWGISSIVVSNISAVVKDIPVYQDKLQLLIEKTAERFHYTGDATLRNLIRKINYTSMFSSLASALQDMTKNTFLVLIYVIFLFMEQANFGRKLELFFSSVAPDRQLGRVMAEGISAMRKYIGVKTVASLVTALLSFLIMHCCHLDYAAFWALLIFLFNYIPSIGSIVATAIPAVLTLVQFESPLVPFICVAGGITAVQFLIGNILEPRFLGTSLNISPLVVLLSLAFWGAIWGIAGMLLCVPIMSIAIMLFAQFDATRPIAILLSGNGRVIVFKKDGMSEEKED